MQRLCVISVADELVRHLLRFSLGAAEYDAVDARIIVDDALQCQVFVLGIHHIIYVVDVLCALIARAYHYFLVVMQVATRNLLYLLTHRSGEEQRIAVLRNILENLVDTVGETHVKHLVSLVKHHVAHGFQLCCATSYEVDEASRCGYDNLGATLQGVHLVNNGCSSVNCHNVDALYILCERLEVIGNLQTQFTCRRDYDGLCGAVCGVCTLQERNAESGGLSSSCLCEGDDLVAIAEQIGYYFFLDGHRMLKSKFFNGAADVAVYAKFFKCLQLLYYVYLFTISSTSSMVRSNGPVCSSFSVHMAAANRPDSSYPLPCERHQR